MRKLKILHKQDLISYRRNQQYLFHFQLVSIISLKNQPFPRETINFSRFSPLLPFILNLGNRETSPKHFLKIAKPPAPPVCLSLSPATSSKYTFTPSPLTGGLVVCGAWRGGVGRMGEEEVSLALSGMSSGDYVFQDSINLSTSSLFKGRGDFPPAGVSPSGW